MALDPATGQPLPAAPPWLTNLPTMQPPAPAEPQHNALVSGLGSGFLGFFGGLGGLTQAAGTAIGSDTIANAGKSFADQEAQRAQAYARPDLDQQPWYSPGRIAQTLGAAIPGTAAAVAGAFATGGGSAAAEGGGALARFLGAGGLGATAAMLPSTVGENVEAAKNANQGNLSTGDAIKALALGAPEAALGAVFPASLEGIIERGAAGGFAKRVFTGAAVNAGFAGGASAAQTAVTQQAFTPDMPITDRAKGIVDSFFGGATTGAVLGGVLSGIHKTTNLNPTDDALKGGTDAALGLSPPTPAANTSAAQLEGPPTPLQITHQPGEPPAPTPPIALGGPFSKVSNEDLTSQAAAMTLKGSDKTQDDQVQHALMQDEILRRTPPGHTPADGTLRSPEQMAALAPAIEQTKALVTQANPKIPPTAPFLQDFNAASVPELVNHIKDTVDEAGSKKPAWLVKVANDFGVMDGEKVSSPAQKLVDLQDQMVAAIGKRDAAVTAGSPAKMRAANKVVTDVSQQITETKPLLALHEAADDLLPKKAAPEPEKPSGAVDETGQGNLHGLGEKSTGSSEAPETSSAAGETQGQRSLFTPEETGERAATRAKFQDSLLNQLGPRDRNAVEPLIRTMNATNDPEMVAALRQHVDDADQNAGGSLSPAFKALADRYGVVDRNGGPRDLQAEHSAASAQYDAMLDRASKANGDGQKAVLLKQATDFRNKSVAPLENLQDIHAQADALGSKPSVVPDRVPARFGDMWRTLDAMKGSPDQDIVQRADTAQRAIEQNNPSAQSIAANVIKRFSDAGRPRVTEAKNAVQEPSATGVDARKPPGNGGAVGEGNPARAATVESEAEAARGQAPNQRQRSAEAYWEKAQIEPNTRLITAAERRAENKKQQLAPDQRAAADQAAADQARVGVKATTPSDSTNWAEAHAADLGGDVVYKDADKALVRGFNDFGHSVYVPVDRASNTRGATDVGSAKATWLDPLSKAKLKREEIRARAADTKAFNANPEGPFKDAQSSVVGTPHADPRVVGMVQGLMDQLGMGSVRVLIAHPDDVRGDVGTQNGLNGAYDSARTTGLDPVENAHMRQFGPGNKDFYIAVKPGMTDGQTKEAVAHEVGHIVQDVALNNASRETRAAVRAAFDSYIKKTEGLNAEQMIRMQRTPEMADAAVAANGPDVKQGALAEDYRNYLRSFDEWFADNAARWTLSADKPKGVIEKFFASVGQKLRDLYNALTGGGAKPDAAVAEFLNHMAPNSDSRWLDAHERGDHIPDDDPVAVTPVQADGLARQSINSFALHARDYVEDTRNSFPEIVRKVTLPLNTLTGIADRMKVYLPQAVDYRNHNTTGSSVRNAKNKANLEGLRGMLALNEKDAESAHRYVAGLQQSPGLDPRKTWAQNADFHKLPNAADWQRRHAELQSELSSLRQRGVYPAVEKMLQNNQSLRYQELTAQAHSYGENWERTTGEPIEGFGPNPDKTFQFRSDLHDNSVATRDFYANELSQRIAGLDKRIGEVDGLAAVMKSQDPAEYKKLTQDSAALGSISSLLKRGKSQADTGLYSPLTHGTGEHFVAAKMDLDPAKLQKLQDMLDKANFHVGINHDTENNSIMMRVDSQGQRIRLANLMDQAHKAGLLDPSEPVKSGAVAEVHTMGNLAPRYLKQMLDHYETILSGIGDVPDDVRTALFKGLTQQWLNSLPDQSLQRSLMERKAVSGYNMNMTQAALMRARNSAAASTGISLNGDFTRIMEGMRSHVQNVKADPNVSNSDKSIASDTAKELLTREAQRSWQVSNKLWDTLQAGMHSIMIGANPAYTLTAMSQVPILLHPELAKTHGYAKSALAIGKAATPAFKALRAIFGGKDGWNLGIRQRDLQASGLPQKYIDLINHLDNAGALSNNSFTRSVTDLGKETDSALGRLKDKANALGSYAELMPRIIGAIAAADLHDARPVKGLTREQFAEKVVNNSQFNWTPGETSRLTGNQGPLGSFSKIAFAFMQFQSRMIEKLYTETHQLFGGNTAQERKEAGRFLAAHLGAVIAIAGTTGLPFANALGGVADKLVKGLTGDDAFDSQGMYRSWLSHVFGADVADVIAKGVPRGLGIDLSHLGDANLLPGTSILLDKRKFEDAQKDWYKSMAGSAFGELGNLYLGGRDMMNGDYMLGATKMLPEGFKGVAEAGYAASHGYVDKNGVKLPVQPSGADIGKMALGLDPANLARYNEAKRIETGLNAQKEYTGQNISRHLEIALQNHNTGDLNYWQHRAMIFKRSNLGDANPLQNLGDEFRGHVEAGARARALGLIVGQKPLDASRKSTDFLQ